MMSTKKSKTWQTGRYQNFYFDWVTGKTKSDDIVGQFPIQNEDFYKDVALKKSNCFPDIIGSLHSTLWLALRYNQDIHFLEHPISPSLEI